MPTKDDSYWHSVMVALSAEYEEKAENELMLGHFAESKAWHEAAAELRLTADQALRTNTVAERMVKGD